MIQFLIADDHALLREGLALALSAAYPESRIHHCDTWAGVHRQVAVHPIDLILLDLFMPRRRAWEDELRRLMAAVPATPVCVLTASAEPAHIQSATAAGERAYLVKTLGAPDVLASLQRVLNGETVLPDADADAAATASADTDPAASLTRRQRQILERLAAGETNREMAEALGLTEDTVKRHVFNLCRKLGARNRVEAVAAAHAGGLLTRY